MPKSKEQFLFVVQTEEGDIALVTKEEVDNAIKSFENSERDLDFETIGKIPTLRLTLDISKNDVQWYKPDEVDDKLINKVILAAVQHLKNP